MEVSVGFQNSGSTPERVLQRSRLGLCGAPCQLVVRYCVHGRMLLISDLEAFEKQARAADLPGPKKCL